jgi:uncharacterized repeat protein (TIGR03803 family)
MGPRTFFTSRVRRLSTVVFALVWICVAPHAMGQQFLDIHDFVQYPNGAYPWPLVSDSAGNLYGQADGGTYGASVVYELSPQANGSYSQKLLYVFQGAPAVGIPDVGGRGPLVFDTAGNLYGASGGSFLPTLDGCGTVWELSPSASGTWTKKTIYAFACTPDGNQPNGILTFDGAGNLYGTTYYGGASNYGTVFELSPNGQGGWIETTLYSFTGQSDGGYPGANLVLDKSGNVYGSTSLGGQLYSCLSNGNAVGCGVYFELSHNPDGSWTENVLYGLLPNDGAGTVQMEFGTDGNLYGVTAYGPYQNYNNPGYGLLFRLSASGGSWNYTILYAFLGGPDGAYPTSLFLGSDGNWHGSTAGGGTLSICPGCGTIFSITPQKNYPWKDKILYKFGRTNQGTNPTGVIADQAGNLYATAGYQYTNQCCGVVSKLTKSASGRWNASVLYGFPSGNDGSWPSTALAQDSAGNLYGTAFYGGQYSSGMLYELVKQADGSWKEQVMHSFQDKADGSNPYYPLVVDSSGNVYGSASPSTGDPNGSVYELKRNASGNWELATIYAFQGGTDGARPGGITIGKNGNIYGITYYGGLGSCNSGSGCGTIFELTRQSGAWIKTTIYQFLGNSDAGAAFGTPVLDDAGNLYGVGWNSTNTAIYELSPGVSGTRTFTVLFDFKAIISNGSIIVADGNIYGVVDSGTSYPYGAVYRVSAAGSFKDRSLASSSALQILYSFTGGTDGAYPTALTRDGVGDLYGTTLFGGLCSSFSSGCGVIFKLTPNAGSWTESVLYDFQLAYGEPSPLIMDSSGNLYGASVGGGTDFNGYVFEYSPNAAPNASRLQKGVR